MKNLAYQKVGEEVVAFFKSDCAKGLSHQDVQAHTQKFGSNELPGEKGVKFLLFLCSNS